MPLTEVKRGKRVRFVAAEADPGLYGRLTAMGLVPGAQIDVLQDSPEGAFVIAVGGSRLALGRETARKIKVA